MFVCHNLTYPTKTCRLLFFIQFLTKKKKKKTDRPANQSSVLPTNHWLNMHRTCYFAGKPVRCSGSIYGDYTFKQAYTNHHKYLKNSYSINVIFKQILLVTSHFFSLKKFTNFVSASFTLHRLLINKQLLGNPCDVAAGIPRIHRPIIDFVWQCWWYGLRMTRVDISHLILLLIGSILQAWTFLTNQWLPYKSSLSDPWPRLHHFCMMSWSSIDVGTLICFANLVWNFV